MIPSIDPCGFFKLAIQPWKFAVKLSTHPCKFALTVSNLQPPLKVWLKVCNKLSINFPGSNPKIKKNLVVFLKNSVYFFENHVFCFEQMRFFISKKVFFQKINRFHVCCWLRKIFKTDVEGCAKYTVGHLLHQVNRPTKHSIRCLGLLTNNHRDLLLGSF